jgi:ribonuclease P protein component
MQKGFVTRSPFFIARSAPTGRTAELAVVASKKRVGSAVKRNRARRRIREAAMIAALPPGDHVVIANSAALEAPFADLVKQLQRVELR